MKKFLAFLLIALTVCSAVEEQIELDGWLKNLWNKVTGAVKKAWNWLKDSGILSKITDLLKTAGKAAATALCSKYFNAETCSSVIGMI